MAQALMPAGFNLDTLGENHGSRAFYRRHGLVEGARRLNPVNGLETLEHRWEGRKTMTTPSAVSLTASAPVFVVQDVAQSVAHYRDVLGFRVEFTYGEPTFYAGVERDRVLIHLQAARETKRAPGQSALYVFVTGVDALHEELKARGARLLGAPRDSFGQESSPAG